MYYIEENDKPKALEKIFKIQKILLKSKKKQKKF